MTTKASGNAKSTLDPALGQVVLVLQGGGALGAYQVGVYQALHENGIEPDWVIGTSIGAINAALIVGNRPEDRMDKLDEFWAGVQHAAGFDFSDSMPFGGSMLPNWSVMTQGIASFFKPNPLAFLGQQVPLAAEAAGYYSTQPLQRTLERLVDFDLVNSGGTRLTVGAANVRTSAMRYFDSRETQIGARHIMASGALPPAFPPVRIDGDLYWDGGILSNTPVEAVFDDKPRRNSLVFTVHIWNPQGGEPESIWQVMNRAKDVQFSSRDASQVLRQQQMHKLRHIIAELAKRLPEAARKDRQVQDMAGYGCLTRMHVVRLLAESLPGEDHTKDIDFSSKGIRTRREAGYADTLRALRQAPWNAEVEATEGFVLHELRHEAALVQV